MSSETQDLQDVAFYYPGHLWKDSDWVKSLLLFFDGISVLIPEYRQDDPELHDPVIAGPLREKQLLHYLVADEVIDKNATTLLTKKMRTLLRSGAFDKLDKEGTAFEGISMSRIGYYGDEKLADELVKALAARGLAKASEDGLQVPVHPIVRYCILAQLGPILRPAGLKVGFDLSPATDQPNVIKALTEFLNIPQLPSAGHVITMDLKTVAVDLSLVPLDEVLDFRKAHRSEYRKYTRLVRRFARELSLLSPEDRARALTDRQEELDDLANDLRKKSESAWRKPTSFALGLAGAAWSFIANPIAGFLSGASLLARGYGESSREGENFSYIFSAQKAFE